MNNLRELHVAFASYVNSEGHWPQLPDSLNSDTSTVGLEDWWINELKPYGATENLWQCPTIKKQLAARSLDRPKVHYMPTMFDSQPATPYRWKTQPWFIEIGNMHGKGSLICFPDGSIQSMDDVLKKAP